MNPAARSLLNDAMVRLADGDRAAFAEVYRALWPAVRTFCRRLVGAEAGAEDVAQQALMKVFDRAGTFDAGADALTWALSITAWECRTALRRVARSLEVAGSDADEVASEASSPEDAIIARNLENAAMMVLGTLSERDRQVLLATVTDDSSPVGVSGASFRKRRQRALERLRAAWRALYGS